MINVISRNKKKALVSLEGEITIQNIGEFKKELLGQTAKFSNIELNVDQLENVDLTFYQVICAFHHHCNSNDVILKIKGDIPEAIKKITETAGFSDKKSCSKIPEQNCIWSGEELNE